jgi:hypothetical protein
VMPENIVHPRQHTRHILMDIDDPDMVRLIHRQCHDKGRRVRGGIELVE